MGVNENVCTKSIDEGFLKKKWFRKEQLDTLALRGGSWGDKKTILHQQLDSSTPPESLEKHDEHDECGCIKGQEGWSSTRIGCHPDAETSAQEATGCKSKAAGEKSDKRDECSCIIGQEGWSSRAQRCAPGSRTDVHEVVRCNPEAMGE